MASKQLGGVGFEYLPPRLLPEPQPSSQSLCKQGVVSSAEGRRRATLDDREDCFGRATVALTRAIVDSSRAPLIENSSMATQQMVIDRPYGYVLPVMELQS